MLSRILGLNKEVYTFQEIHFFERMIASNELNDTVTEKKAIDILNQLIGIEVEGFYKQADITIYSNESKEILSDSNLIGNEFKAIDVYNAYLTYWTKKKGKTIPCEQTPKNIFYIEEILRYFPDAKIINMVRDPRSVLLSQKNKWKRRLLGEDMPFMECLRAWVNYHPITISKLWVSSIRKIENHGFSKSIRSERYEDLIAAPETKVKNICDFCNIDFDKSMLNIPHVGSSIGFDKPQKKGINKNNSFTWKRGGLNASEIYILQKISKKEMERYGYILEDIKPNYLYLSYFFITFPIKLLFSFVLNLHRMKNIIETIKKRLI